jgi:predicted hydrocarbon binding protein
MLQSVAKINLMPYFLGTVVVKRDGNPFFFNVVLSPEAYMAVGVLNEITKVFLDENAPVLFFKASFPPTESDGEFRVVVSADLKDLKQAERIVSRLKRVRYVVGVDLAPPMFRGVGIDRWSYPLMIWNYRAIVFKVPTFGRFIRWGWEKIGFGFGGILYRAFFEAGREEYENFYSKIATSKEELVMLLEETIRLMGYGILKTVKLTDDRAVFCIHDNVECKSLMGVEGAENAMLRGLLAGWLSGYWGVDIYFIRPKETRCIIRGDPYCQLEYKKEKYEPLV